MAKPKSPNSNPNLKKNAELKPTVSPITGPPSGSGNASAAAAPALETNAVSTKNTATPRKAESRKATRKPNVAKTEPRDNLVPISLEEEIRQLAYLFSERRGFQSGHETEDWLAAENEVRQRYRQHSA